MAQGGRKKSRGPKPVAGSSSKGSKKGRSSAGRSVAAARGHGGNRTQLMIAGAAVIVIIAIVVVGVITTANKTAVQGSGYGVSTETTASVTSPGIITVSNGSPELTLDIYEDALCPACAQLEHQYGEQIAKAMDEGKLIVNYRMVDFLNAGSASGNYSSRAFAALLAVAKGDGDKPGVFMKFHTALYDPDNQPKEKGNGGTSDLSNDELADLAGDAGASEKTQKQISSGAEVDAATKAADTNLKSMEAASTKGGFSRSGTPTVALNGARISTADTSWLSDLLAEESSGELTESNAPAQTEVSGTENESPVTGTQNQSPVTGTGEQGKSSAASDDTAGKGAGGADSATGSSGTGTGGAGSGGQ